MPPKKTAKRRSRKETLEEDLTKLLHEENINDELISPILKEALNEGVDVNLIIDNRSLICYFAFYGMIRCFEECFLLGADPTIVTTECPKDALVSAVRGIASAAISLRMVVSLSNHVKFNDLKQNEAIERACDNCRFNVARLLLRRNQSYADIVLWWGVRRGSATLVEIALEFSARVNQLSRDGRYPIHRAAELQDSSILQKLLDAGADIEAKHKSTNETPFEIAVRCDTVRCVRLLIDRKCKFSSKDALLLAINCRSHDVLREFLSKDSFLLCFTEGLSSRSFVFSAVAQDDLTAFKIMYPISKFSIYFINRLVRLEKYDMLSAALFEFEHPDFSPELLTPLIPEAPNADFKSLLQKKINSMKGVDLVAKVKKEAEEEGGEELEFSSRTKKKTTKKTTTKSKKTIKGGVFSRYR